MTKRFWKWNAILSFLAFIWMSIVLYDGPKFIVALLLTLPLMMSIQSLFSVVRNTTKPDDAIVGLFDYDVKKPKKQLRNILQERIGIAISYSLAIGLPFRYLSVLDEHLQLWLMLGTFLLGAAYILYALFDYARKSDELEE